MAQISYSDTMTPGRPGELADNGPCDVLSITNDSPRAAQIETVTIDTVANATAYSVTINGVTFTYTSDASATDQEIVDGLVALIVADAIVSASVTAAGASSSTFTITANTGGIGFTFAESDSNLSSVATTANDEADPVPFGAAIIGDGSDGQGRLLAAGGLTKQVSTITVAGTPENSKEMGGTILVEGIPYEVAAKSTGSATLTNTATQIKNAVNSSGAPVTATSAAGVVTITADEFGEDFRLDFDAPDLSTMTLSIADGEPVITDDLDEMFIGIALHEYDHEIDRATGVAQYKGGETMSVARRGRVRVTTDAAVSFGARVYAKLSDGVTFSSTAQSGFIELRNCRWHASLAADLGVLQVR